MIPELRPTGSPLSPRELREGCQPFHTPCWRRGRILAPLPPYTPNLHPLIAPLAVRAGWDPSLPPSATSQEKMEGETIITAQSQAQALSQRAQIRPQEVCWVGSAPHMLSPIPTAPPDPGTQHSHPGLTGLCLGSAASIQALLMGACSRECRQLMATSLRKPAHFIAKGSAKLRTMLGGREPRSQGPLSPLLPRLPFLPSPLPARPGSQFQAVLLTPSWLCSESQRCDKADSADEAADSRRHSRGETAWTQDRNSELGFGALASALLRLAPTNTTTPLNTKAGLGKRSCQGPSAPGSAPTQDSVSAAACLSRSHVTPHVIPNFRKGWRAVGVGGERRRGREPRSLRALYLDRMTKPIGSEGGSSFPAWRGSDTSMLTRRAPRNPSQLSVLPPDS